MSGWRKHWGSHQVREKMVDFGLNKKSRMAWFGHSFELQKNMNPKYIEIKLNFEYQTLLFD